MPRFRPTMAEEKNEIGVATGLAWTEVGGEILVTEATLMPGKGHLTLTGKLGDVMQESAQAAMSYVRSKADEFGIPKNFNRKTDVHVHIPEGAIPKDGPSAGITLATALVSALARIPVRKDVAMTGEITLRGKVLPIGGVKEKVLAAHRAGLKTIILPRDNEKDLADIPKNVLDALDIYMVDTMDEVLKIALAGTAARARRATPPPPKSSPPFRTRPLLTDDAVRSRSDCGRRGDTRSAGIVEPARMPTRSMKLSAPSSSPARLGRDGIPRDGLAQVAFAGRSNVGKSSLINALCRTKIARTSAAPGKTRLANIYRVTVEGGPGGPGAGRLLRRPAGLRLRARRRRRRRGAGGDRSAGLTEDSRQRGAEPRFRVRDAAARRLAASRARSPTSGRGGWLDAAGRRASHVVATKIDKLRAPSGARET